MFQRFHPPPWADPVDLAEVVKRDVDRLGEGWRQLGRPPGLTPEEFEERLKRLRDNVEEQLMGLARYIQERAGLVLLEIPAPA
ncbi:hypothetical protein LCGC14_1350640 [marine sediment metagenome]|uniref:Uncharacterized protein n=1 Tax=marine sediment metagenome TaxID=412755 RepID=A0A0F9MRW2_9ZZZZ